MTDTDRIAQMAREAGLHINGQTSEERIAACARFARLVAEDCAEVAQSTVCDTHLPTGVRIYGTRASEAILARIK